MPGKVTERDRNLEEGPRKWIVKRYGQGGDVRHTFSLSHIGLRCPEITEREGGQGRDRQTERQRDTDRQTHRNSSPGDWEIR